MPHRSSIGRIASKYPFAVRDATNEPAQLSNMAGFPGRSPLGKGWRICGHIPARMLLHLH
ncbi:hypothetical protein FSB08_03420 [Paraburkholderia sp. JPY432]|nr:hypothetical protein [Paraburkholderia youngii]